MALLSIRPRKADRGRNRLFSGLIAALLVVGTAGEARAQRTPTPEYRVKAVFLYHFTQFVTWPATAFRAPTDPLVIGVLGDDPFGDYLDEAVRGEAVGQHEMIVRRYRRAEDVGDCHILFVSDSDSRLLRSAIATMATRPVLTVGDTQDFARRGGIVEFVTEDERIRFRINAGAARAAGLTISSKLLSLADAVLEGGS